MSSLFITWGQPRNEDEQKFTLVCAVPDRSLVDANIDSLHAQFKLLWLEKQFLEKLRLTPAQQARIDDEEIEHPVKRSTYLHFTYSKIEALEVDLAGHPEFEDWESWECPYEGKDFDNLWSEYTAEFADSTMNLPDFWMALLGSDFNVPDMESGYEVKLQVSSSDSEALAQALNAEVWPADFTFCTEPSEMAKRELWDVLYELFDDGDNACMNRVQVNPNSELSSWLDTFRVWEDGDFNSHTHNELQARS